MASMLRVWLLGAGLLGCSYAPDPAVLPGDAADPVDSLVTTDSPPDGSEIVWLHPWGHRKPITILASKIEAPGDLGALADFPVLIALTDLELAAATQLPDMAFTTSDATTLLDYEIESYDPALGKLTAWVRIPSLSETDDTEIYLYYGNPAGLPSDGDAVWTGGYQAVWHLSQDPGPGGAGEIRDATAGNHDGTASGGMDPADSTDAQIGKGLRFDGTADFINLATLDVGNAFTISVWLNLDADSTAVIKTLVANSQSNFNRDGWRFFVNTSGTADRKVLFETGDGTNGSSLETAIDAVSAGSWTQVVAVIDRGNGSGKIFVNGVDATVNPGVQSDFLTNSDLEIARMEANGAVPFDGILDEVSIASTLRPPEWITTAYANQVAPADFVMVGLEQDEP
jgi:biopolymer transport protein ExbB